mgnify:CR=1 FL=1
MTKQPRQKRAFGALHVVTSLLIASAALRLVTEVAPAMANEAVTDVSAEPGPPVVAGDTESLLAALQARDER